MQSKLIKINISDMTNIKSIASCSVIHCRLVFSDIPLLILMSLLSYTHIQYLNMWMYTISSIDRVLAFFIFVSIIWNPLKISGKNIKYSTPWNFGNFILNQKIVISIWLNCIIAFEESYKYIPLRGISSLNTKVEHCIDLQYLNCCQFQIYFQILSSNLKPSEIQ